MEIRLRPIRFDHMEDFICLAKWLKDPEIKHLFTVDFNNGPTMPTDPSDIRRAKAESKSVSTYMIEADGQVIGDASIDTSFGKLMGQAEGTGWLSICIGEKAYRGKGLGVEVMALLEETCKNMGLTRMELGVFVYNKTAIKFYEKMGFRHFATIENFTWYEGQWYDDLRMEKYII